MSRWVVLVPGIMGSSLRLDGESVWPPSTWEYISGYDKIKRLMDNGVEVGEIIDRVSIKSVYRTLLRDIEACGYFEGNAERRFIPFPYDWRKSNLGTAALLADHLDTAVDQWGLPGEISLIAHSMGGLVSRRILEGGDYTPRSWFSRIKRLITLGTPHFGAPKALVQLSGRESVLGVSGTDVVRLGSDPRYPSLYELAGPSGSAFTLKLPLPGEVPEVIDRFEKPIVDALRLNAANIGTANAFWSRLEFSRRPADVKYFFVGGASHTTVTTCQLEGGLFDTVARESSGDGTVPVSSAIVVGIPHGFSRKEHVRIFEDREVRKALYRFLDAPADVYPQGAGSEQVVGAAGTAGLSVNKEVYRKGEPIEIVVSYAQAIDSARESFGFIRIDPKDTDRREPVDNIDISLDGGRVSSFAVTIGPALEPGMYQLTTNRPTDDPESTFFYVAQEGGSDD